MPNQNIVSKFNGIMQSQTNIKDLKFGDVFCFLPDKDQWWKAAGDPYLEEDGQWAITAVPTQLLCG